MKAAVLGVLIGAGLLVLAAWAWAGPRDAVAAAGVGGGELISLTAPVGDARQLLTVIDPKQRVISVYHIELATGEISLKSVRNIHWDLQMSEFNGVNPLPREIRSQIEHR